MKYYIYISDAKIDMLYPQIPQSLLKKIASSLSIDLKLLGAELSIGAKGNPSDETRYSKVRIVSEYIEKHLDVGTIDAPSTYLKGKLSMLHEICEKPQPMVFFVGSTPRTIIGLGGSPEHIVGSKLKSEYNSSLLSGSSSLGTISTFLYYRYKLYKKVYGLLGKDTDTVFYPNRRLEGLPYIVYHQWLDPKSYPEQHLEFLAKTLQQDQLHYSLGEFDKNITQSYGVIGTPIYVALAD